MPITGIIYLDMPLSTHVDNLSIKLPSSIFLLIYLSKQCVTQHVLKIAYYSLIHSHIIYGKCISLSRFHVLSNNSLQAIYFTEKKQLELKVILTGEICVETFFMNFSEY